MADSLTTIPLKHQPPKDPRHFLVGRIFPKLRHGQHIGRFGQAVDLIVVGKSEVDFHSVHRHGAGIAQAVAPVPREPRKDTCHMLVGGVLERFVRQLRGFGKEVFGFVFGHLGIVGGVGCGVHSWFPWVIAMSIFFSSPVTTTDKRFYQ